jgi:stearoyl-CoA desaturase (Delta-9 desaturase)
MPGLLSQISGTCPAAHKHFHGGCMSSVSTYKTLSNRTVVHTLGALIVVVPLLGTIVAIQLLWERAVHWSDLVLLATGYSLGMLGIAVGFHRMLTHRSFRPHPVVKAILLVLGSTTAEGPALDWAATHIKHHAQSDREGDPHSPVEGLFHAHVGWLFKDSLADPNIYCRHLLKDPLIVFISRTFPLWVALSLVIPFLIGGWTGLIWGGLVRMFLVNHVVWGVNSLCHTFGKREFETNDRSHNLWIMALLTFGEGWHHNHHAFPRSAFVGLHWWQLDLSGGFIWLLGRLGLANDIHVITPDALERRSSRSSRKAE